MGVERKRFQRYHEDMPAPEASPPSYIRFDQKQREEFLSQFGITTPNQRVLFQQLCDSWRPVISFDRFVASRSNQAGNIVHELENLLAKLKSAKLGILGYKRNEKGERSPHEIILCEENDARYWFYFVQDLVQQAVENPRNPYLTLALLKSREILIPADNIEDYSLAQVSKSGIDAVAKTEKLLYLSLQGEKVLVTSLTLNLLLGFASARLRYTLKNTEVIAAVSRLMNLGLTELMKRVEEKDAVFWKTLTETLMRNKEDLAADRKLHLEKGFFQSAELFLAFLVNQSEEARKQKEKDVERETDLRQIEQIVLKDKDGLLEVSDLDSQIKLLFGPKYAAEFPLFKEEFYTQFTQPQNKMSIPVVVSLKNGLIHRNNFYRYFLKRFEKVRALTWEQYSRRMDRMLRTGNRAGDVTFVNKDNWERSLVEWTAEADPIVAEVFKNAKLLAEGLIHYGKTVLNLSSVEEMRGLMEQFFKPGIIVYRPLYEIYDLDPKELFESAFKRFSVISQFWWRMTGRYRIQAEHYSKLVPPKLGSVAKPAAEDGIDKRPVRENEEEEIEISTDRKTRHEQWLERKRSGNAKKPSSPAHVPEPEKPKEYTPKERDKAWTSFRDSIKKP